MRLPCSFVLGLSLATSAFSQVFDDGTHAAANPQTAQEQAANEALEAHDWDRALKLLTPLAEANPKNARLLYDLGQVQDALDQSSGAEKSYRAAIADDAALLEPRVALGLLLARNGHRDEARAELLAATGVPVPKDSAAGPLDSQLRARAYRALARLDQTTRPAEARDELIAALKLTPETPDDALLAGELAAAANDSDADAEAEYRRVLTARPNDPQATAALAHLLAKSKRQAEAEKLLTAALAANPGNPALTAQLASLYAGEGRTADAVPLVEAVYKANPQDADVAHLLAGLYLDQKAYALAEPLLAKVALARPGDTSVVMERADALIHLKRYPEAEALLTRLVAQPKLFSTPAALGDACGELAFAASENNDPLTTLQALRVRATVLPPSGPTLFLAAISEDKLHHTKAAIQAYRDFLAASQGQMPDQEFEAQHRIVALQHTQ